MFHRIRHNPSRTATDPHSRPCLNCQSKLNPAQSVTPFCDGFVTDFRRLKLHKNKEKLSLYVNTSRCHACPRAMSAYAYEGGVTDLFEQQRLQLNGPVVHPAICLGHYTAVSSVNRRKTGRWSGKRYHPTILFCNQGIPVAASKKSRRKHRVWSIRPPNSKRRHDRLAHGKLAILVRLGSSIPAAWNHRTPRPDADTAFRHLPIEGHRNLP